MTDKAALKPIETHFDGYRFRSRLEARWAVFFKTLGIEYEYEKEGFNLSRPWEWAVRHCDPSVSDQIERDYWVEQRRERPWLDNLFYLPDFWLPSVTSRGETGIWLEIKGQKPIEEEFDKGAWLRERTGSPVVIFVGLPQSWGGGKEDTGYELQGFMDTNMMFAKCTNCGQIDILSPMEGDNFVCPSCSAGYPGKLSQFHPTILAAQTAARSARFEHGENGARR